MKYSTKYHNPKTNRSPDGIVAYEETKTFLRNIMPILYNSEGKPCIRVLFNVRERKYKKTRDNRTEPIS